VVATRGVAASGGPSLYCRRPTLPRGMTTGQDIAEYAVMLEVILVIVVGTIKIIGGKSTNIFSEVASSRQ